MDKYIIHGIITKYLHIFTTSKKNLMWGGTAFILIIGGIFLSLPKIITPSDSRPLLPSASRQRVSNELLQFKDLKHKLPPKIEEVSFIAVGDIMLSRVVGQKMRQNGFDYPFSRLKDYLATGDVVFGNLETAITPGREIKTGEMIFRADRESAKALKDANFSILSLANNHTPNFGDKGLLNTFFYLKEVGIAYVGAGENEIEAYKPVYLEKKGINFAFLAYNDSDVVPPSYRAGTDNFGTAFMDEEKLVQAVQEAQMKADFVIISMHSGSEYAHNPNTSQISFAHSAIDAGGDLVIGHHPHVVQSAEVYKGKYIFYSLGNFIFDQMWSEDTRIGLMIKLNFTKEAFTKVEFLPIYIEDFAVPRFAPDKKAVLTRLNLPFEEGMLPLPKF